MLAGAWKGTSLHLERQIGQSWFPCLTLEAMQLKWKAWEHSAVKIAWPCPVFRFPKQMAHVFLEDRVLKLRVNMEVEEEEEEERDDGDRTTSFLGMSGERGKEGRE